MNRFILSGVSNAGETGSEVYCTQVYDRCGTCQKVLRQSTVSLSPLVELNYLFSSFEQGQLTRGEFDRLVSSQFIRHGGSGVETA